MMKHPLTLCAALVTFVHNLEQGDADSSGSLLHTAGAVFLFIGLVATLGALFITFQSRASISRYHFAI